MLSSETSCIILFLLYFFLVSIVFLEYQFWYTCYFIHALLHSLRSFQIEKTILWHLETKTKPFLYVMKNTYFFSIFKLSFNVYIKISPVFTPLKCIVSLLWWSESILVGENKLSLQVLVSRKSVRMLSYDDRYSQRIGWRWPILTKNRVKMTDTHN